MKTSYLARKFDACFFKTYLDNDDQNLMFGLEPLKLCMSFNDIILVGLSLSIILRIFNISQILRKKLEDQVQSLYRRL